MNESAKRLKEISAKISDKDRKTSEFRKNNRKWLRKSSQIALSIMHQIDERGITKTELASMIGVSPSYIGKLLRGNENLTLETITKLEEVLEVELVIINRTYYQTPIYVMVSETESVQSTDMFYNNTQSLAV